MSLTQIETDNIINNSQYVRDEIIEYIKNNFKQYTLPIHEVLFLESYDKNELSEDEYCIGIASWFLCNRCDDDDLTFEGSILGSVEEFRKGKALILKRMSNEAIQASAGIESSEIVSSAAPNVSSDLVESKEEEQSVHESEEGELEEKTYESESETETEIDNEFEEKECQIFGQCNVCYKDLNEKNIVNTPCKHNFCTDCFFRWMKEKTNCPCCRREYCETPLSTDAEIREEMGLLYRIRTELLNKISDLSYENYAIENNVENMYFRKQNLMDELLLLNKNVISNRETIEWQNGYIDGVYAKNIEDSAVTKKEIREYIQLFLRQASSNNVGSTPYTCGFIQGFQKIFQHNFQVPDELNDLIDYEIEFENNKLLHIINKTVDVAVKTTLNNIINCKENNGKENNGKENNGKERIMTGKKTKNVKKSLKVSAVETSDEELDIREYEKQLAKKKKNVDRMIRHKNEIAKWGKKEKKPRFINDVKKVFNKKEKTKYRAIYVKSKKGTRFDPTRYRIRGVSAKNSDYFSEDESDYDYEDSEVSE